jgi:hypothetical protein
MYAIAMISVAWYGRESRCLNSERKQVYVWLQRGHTKQMGREENGGMHASIHAVIAEFTIFTLPLIPLQYLRSF